MKLIVLYGPPAVGKYTVAKIIAERTGYKLFHNHLTIDMLSSVFEFGSQGFFDLSQKIRLDVFELAAQQGIAGLVFTFVYAKGEDDDFVREVCQRVVMHGGEVVFVQLYCEKEGLMRRVTLDSRKEFKKIGSKEGLDRSLMEYDQMSPISFVKNVMIDSTHLTVEETVEQVLSSVKLR